VSEAASLQGGAARRAQNYFLLSRLIHEPPGAGLLEEISAFPVIAGEDAALAADLTALRRVAAESSRDPEGVTALAVEFTRVLGGLSERGGAPPIESVARESRLLGDAAAAVAVAYADAGFPEPLTDAGPPDHLATELRFLALCAYEEAEAWKRGDRAAALAWLDRESAFLNNHLGAWVPDYCRQLAQRAAESYYAIVARLIARACAMDREDLTAILRYANRSPRAARR
jgi:TorA maturation chaperone TorD